MGNPTGPVGSANAGNKVSVVTTSDSVDPVESGDQLVCQQVPGASPETKELGEAGKKFLEKNLKNKATFVCSLFKPRQGAVKPLKEKQIAKLKEVLADTVRSACFSAGINENFGFSPVRISTTDNGATAFQFNLVPYDHVTAKDVLRDSELFATKFLSKAEPVIKKCLNSSGVNKSKIDIIRNGTRSFTVTVSR